MTTVLSREFDIVYKIQEILNVENMQNITKIIQYLHQKHNHFTRKKVDF